MRIGTKSVLYGAHCFFIHPWFVALAWWKLYGFPFDPRLWLCFFVHDIGYLGKPNMDGEEGERHIFIGAHIVRRLLGTEWAEMCILHSRYWAKRLNRQPSRLCFADKLAFVLTPAWLYMAQVWLTGEWREYAAAHNHEVKHNANTLREWYYPTRQYMREWVHKFQHGETDTWTVQKPNSTQVPPPASDGRTMTHSTKRS